MAKRQDKYPNTSTFVYYNANPKGLITGDCVFRAVAHAFGISWRDAMKEMCELSLKNCHAPNYVKGFEEYLKINGWVKHPQPKKPDGKKYTGKEFCKEFNIDCIVNIGSHHTVSIKDGKVYDHWDCTDGKIGNYWTKG